MFLLTYSQLVDNEQGIPYMSRLKRTFCVRRIQRISRRALGEPSELPFMKLFNLGCVQSIITYTGFDFQAFSDLLQLFQPQFEHLSPYSMNGRIRSVRRVNGRMRKITAILCLGLVIAWMQTRGKLNILLYLLSFIYFINSYFFSMLLFIYFTKQVTSSLCN
jgi:hypothetical protein